MENSTIISENLFPPVVRNWADKLYAAGLMIYVFACNFSISASQTGLSLAMIGFIAMYRQGRITVRKTPLDAPFAFMALTGLLSVFRAEDLSRAIPELKIYLLIFCFYLAYWPRMSENFQKTLFTIFIVSAGIMGLLNSYRMPDLELTGNRAKGFFSTSMTFGECQTIATLAILTLFGFIKTNTVKMSLLLMGGIATTYSVIFSMVRGAWLGLTAGSLLLLYSFPKRTFIALTIIALSISPLIYFSSDIQERFGGLSLQQTAAIAGKNMDEKFPTASLEASYRRLTIWLRGFQMFENNYAFGVGMNNVKTWYKRLATEFEFKSDLIWGHQHNNFIQIMVMTGFIGLIAFFYFILEAIKLTWRAKKSDNIAWSHSLSLGAASILICFLITGLTEYSWGDEEVSMMALFITGLMMNRSDDYFSTSTAGATATTE
ncbi:MAG: O-antigen ligase family protein [Erysipelotrichia bacterium]|nr:O-antigen ligase family protein [Erysipelotrichia bacterium]